MKATGIVRRIDDLGRVVIPKEIRRTMRIREGDPLEIYTSREGEIIFKKYSPIKDLSKFATEYTESLFEALRFPILFLDSDEVIAVAGLPKKGFLHRKITTQAEELMMQRKVTVVTEETEVEFVYGQFLDVVSFCAVPILVSGDVVGGIYMLGQEEQVTDQAVKCAEVAALFIGKQLQA